MPELHSSEFAPVSELLLAGTLSPIPTQKELRKIVEVEFGPGEEALERAAGGSAALGGRISVNRSGSAEGGGVVGGRSSEQKGAVGEKPQRAMDSQIVTYTRDVMTGLQLSPPVLASKATLQSPLSLFLEGCFHNHGMVTAGHDWPEAVI